MALLFLPELLTSTRGIDGAHALVPKCWPDRLSYGNGPLPLSELDVGGVGDESLSTRLWNTRITGCYHPKKSLTQRGGTVTRVKFLRIYIFFENYTIPRRTTTHHTTRIKIISELNQIEKKALFYLNCAMHVQPWRCSKWFF